VKVAVANEAEMRAFGAALARTLSPRDRVALIGELGAGKTTLARAVLRILGDDPDLEVPSPTFTIVQSYDLRIPVRHVDLYRIGGAAELAELGLGEGDAAELVEWPREEMPITITIAFGADDEQRTVTVEAPEEFVVRLRRHLALGRFLSAAGWGWARRRTIAGDASTRRYERLDGDGPAILMDAPVYTPGPDAYATRARLADGNIHAFLAVGEALRARGLSAPEPLAVDAREGFLLLEDLGDAKVHEAGRAIPERYLVAADALAAFHRDPLPLPLPGPDLPAFAAGRAVPAPRVPHGPPLFDADLAAVEVGVFEEWYARTPPDAAFEALWRAAIDALPRDDDRVALRDYHSPNLLWLARREGIARIGIIDYQDAMIAPSSYDVVSLAQDARVDVPDDLEAAIVERYLAARPGVDRDAFLTAYAVVGAERATRILGVFRRLNDRDGKPQYLPHIPRLRRYLEKSLAHPALADLRAWFAARGVLSA
jgi:tRNA threonylcarbamoyl adenosine modification protein YjeE